MKFVCIQNRNTVNVNDGNGINVNREKVNFAIDETHVLVVRCEPLLQSNTIQNDEKLKNRNSSIDPMQLCSPNAGSAI